MPRPSESPSPANRVTSRALEVASAFHWKSDDRLHAGSSATFQVPGILRASPATSNQYRKVCRRPSAPSELRHSTLLLLVLGSLLQVKSPSVVGGLTAAPAGEVGQRLHNGGSMSKDKSQESRGGTAESRGGTGTNACTQSLVSQSMHKDIPKADPFH